MSGKILLRLIATVLLATQCNSTVRLDPEQPFKKLSDYQFFTGDIKSLTPNDRVLPYDIITPLFSDYAEKARFVWIPPGKQARVVNMDETFEFPVGSVLIKNFYYYHDIRDPQQGRQIIETRLLIHRDRGWDALTYVWNQEQTEAHLEIAGDVQQVSWIDSQGRENSTSFIIPNKNQCKGCHEYKKELTPIGPKVKHLNRQFDYPSGNMNQLSMWQSSGILEEMEQQPGQLPQIAAWDDSKEALDKRALAYMEINCGICHSEQGPAYISGLYLHTGTTNPNHLGFCKSPVSAGSGSGGHRYDVVPGRPDQSILLYRMRSLNPGEMMPELGRTVVHTEGVELIREWIASLNGGCPESL